MTRRKGRDDEDERKTWIEKKLVVFVSLELQEILSPFFFGLCFYKKD